MLPVATCISSCSCTRTRARAAEYMQYSIAAALAGERRPNDGFNARRYYSGCRSATCGRYFLAYTSVSLLWRGFFPAPPLLLPLLPDCAAAAVASCAPSRGRFAAEVAPAANAVMMLLALLLLRAEEAEAAAAAPSAGAGANGYCPACLIALVAAVCAVGSLDI